MKKLIEEIQADINWRIAQLAMIKTLPTKYKMQKHHVEALIWYSVPSIYALWEGYISTTFQSYSNFISKKNLDANKLDINLITHTIDYECELDNHRVHFNTKKDFITQIFDVFSNPININQNVPDANANYDKTNHILERYNMPPLDNKFKKPLNKFLKFRNHIAHGEKSILVEKTDIEQFTLLVGDLMYEILLKIEDSVENESYKYIP